MDVAVIGIGKLGQRHLDKWSEIDGVKIVGVIARREAELKKVSAKYNTQAYKSIVSLMEEQSVDVIDICTPTHTHHLFIRQAALAKTAIICEKPIGLTFAEANEIMILCKENNVLLFIAHTLEFFPIYETTKEYIQTGVLGHSLNIHMARGVPYPADSRAWYTDESKSGGLFLDLGIHEFEWILTTLGDVKTISTTDIRYAADQTIIYGVVHLKLVSGGYATIEVSWDEPAFRASFTIEGSKGKITYNHTDRVPTFTQYDKTESIDRLFENLSEEDPYVRQLTHFKKCIEGETEPLLTVDYAAKAVQIAELARKSVTDGIQKV